MSAEPDPLFAPWALGQAQIRNRVMLSAMTTGFGYTDGYPDERFVDYLSTVGADVGLATVAFGAVRPDGRVERQIPWLWQPGIEKRLADVTSMLHSLGARASLQIGHGGRQVSARVIQADPVGPSPLPPAAHVSQPPRELPTAEVYDVIEAFVRGAVVAQDAGFDTVEVHAGHGYLVQQFLSADSNHRVDEFGGATAWERSAFGRAIISGIRERAPGLAVIVRINGDDLIPGGMTAAEACEAARAFAFAGADGLVVSAGVYGSVPWTIPVLDDREPSFLDAARTIRQVVDIPVIAVGGFRSPAAAREAIRRGDCDAVALGRHLLADPRWVDKARRGTDSRIRPCIATLQGCAGQLQAGGEISCTVNPDIGRPRPRRRASRPARTVVIVGGGPAGMEAARAAAEVGDDVVLYEAGEHLGGAARLAGLTPPLAHFTDLVQWYQRELARLGVSVQLGTAAEPGQPGLAGADLVLCATGAQTLLPDLDGYEHLPAWTAADLLAGRPSTHGSATPPQHAVVAGAGTEALSVALWLHRQGSTATILAEGRLASDTSGIARRALRARLDAAGINVRSGSPIELTTGGVRTASGLIAADALVLAGPRVPVRWGMPEAARIGDARVVQGIGAAVEEGRAAVRYDLVS